MHKLFCIFYVLFVVVSVTACSSSSFNNSAEQQKANSRDAQDELRKDTGKY